MQVNDPMNFFGHGGPVPNANNIARDDTLVGSNEPMDMAMELDMDPEPLEPMKVDSLWSPPEQAGAFGPNGLHCPRFLNLPSERNLSGEGNLPPETSPLGPNNLLGPNNFLGPKNIPCPDAVFENGTNNVFGPNNIPCPDSVFANGSTNLLGPNNLVGPNGPTNVFGPNGTTNLLGPKNIPCPNSVFGDGANTPQNAHHMGANGGGSASPLSGAQTPTNAYRSVLHAAAVGAGIEGTRTPTRTVREGLKDKLLSGCGTRTPTTKVSENPQAARALQEIMSVRMTDARMTDAMIISEESPQRRPKDEAMELAAQRWMMEEDDIDFDIEDYFCFKNNQPQQHSLEGGWRDNMGAISFLSGGMAGLGPGQHFEPGKGGRGPSYGAPDLMLNSFPSDSTISGYSFSDQFGPAPPDTITTDITSGDNSNSSLGQENVKLNSFASGAGMAALNPSYPLSYNGPSASNNITRTSSSEEEDKDKGPAPKPELVNLFAPSPEDLALYRPRGRRNRRLQGRPGPRIKAPAVSTFDPRQFVFPLPEDFKPGKPIFPVADKPGSPVGTSDGSTKPGSPLSTSDGSTKPGSPVALSGGSAKLDSPPAPPSSSSHQVSPVKQVSPPEKVDPVDESETEQLDPSDEVRSSFNWSFAAPATAATDLSARQPTATNSTTTIGTTTIGTTTIGAVSGQSGGEGPARQPGPKSPEPQVAKPDPRVPAPEQRVVAPDPQPDIPDRVEPAEEWVITPGEWLAAAEQWPPAGRRVALLETGVWPIKAVVETTREQRAAPQQGGKATLREGNPSTLRSQRPVPVKDKQLSNLRVMAKGLFKREEEETGKKEGAVGSVPPRAPTPPQIFPRSSPPKSLYSSLFPDGPFPSPPLRPYLALFPPDPCSSASALAPPGPSSSSSASGPGPSSPRGASSLSPGVPASPQVAAGASEPRSKTTVSTDSTSGGTTITTRTKLPSLGMTVTTSVTLAKSAEDSSQSSRASSPRRNATSSTIIRLNRVKASHPQRVDKGTDPMEKDLQRVDAGTYPMENDPQRVDKGTDPMEDISSESEIELDQGPSREGRGPDKNNRVTGTDRGGTSRDAQVDRGPPAVPGAPEPPLSTSEGGGTGARAQVGRDGPLIASWARIPFPPSDPGDTPLTEQETPTFGIQSGHTLGTESGTPTFGRESAFGTSGSESKSPPAVIQVLSPVRPTSRKEPVPCIRLQSHASHKGPKALANDPPEGLRVDLPGPAGEPIREPARELGGEQVRDLVGPGKPGQSEAQVPLAPCLRKGQGPKVPKRVTWAPETYAPPVPFYYPAGAWLSDSEEGSAPSGQESPSPGPRLAEWTKAERTPKRLRSVPSKVLRRDKTPWPVRAATPPPEKETRHQDEDPERKLAPSGHVHPVHSVPAGPKPFESGHLSVESGQLPAGNDPLVVTSSEEGGSSPTGTPNEGDGTRQAELKEPMAEPIGTTTKGSNDPPAAVVGEGGESTGTDRDRGAADAQKEHQVAPKITKKRKQEQKEQEKKQQKEEKQEKENNGAATSKRQDDDAAPSDSGDTITNRPSAPIAGTAEITSTDTSTLTDTSTVPSTITVTSTSARAESTTGESGEPCKVQRGHETADPPLATATATSGTGTSNKIIASEASNCSGVTTPPSGGDTGEPSATHGDTCEFKSSPKRPLVTERVVESGECASNEGGLSHQHQSQLPSSPSAPSSRREEGAELGAGGKHRVQGESDLMEAPPNGQTPDGEEGTMTVTTSKTTSTETTVVTTVTTTTTSTTTTTTTTRTTGPTITTITTTRSSSDGLKGSDGPVEVIRVEERAVEHPFPEGSTTTGTDTGTAAGTSTDSGTNEGVEVYEKGPKEAPLAGKSNGASTVGTGCTCTCHGCKGGAVIQVTERGDEEELDLGGSPDHGSMLPSYSNSAVTSEDGSGEGPDESVSLSLTSSNSTINSISGDSDSINSDTVTSLSSITIGNDGESDEGMRDECSTPTSEGSPIELRRVSTLLLPSPVTKQWPPSSCPSPCNEYNCSPGLSRSGEEDSEPISGPFTPGSNPVSNHRHSRVECQESGRENSTSGPGNPKLDSFASGSSVIGYNPHEHFDPEGSAKTTSSTSTHTTSSTSSHSSRSTNHLSSSSTNSLSSSARGSGSNKPIRAGTSGGTHGKSGRGESKRAREGYDSPDEVKTIHVYPEPRESLEVGTSVPFFSCHRPPDY